MSKHASVFILRPYIIKKPQVILVVFKNFSPITKEMEKFVNLCLSVTFHFDKPLYLCHLRIIKNKEYENEKN